jgi:hypothetical protein
MKDEVSGGKERRGKGRKVLGRPWSFNIDSSPKRLASVQLPYPFAVPTGFPLWPVAFSRSVVASESTAPNEATTQASVAGTSCCPKQCINRQPRL